MELVSVIRAGAGDWAHNGNSTMQKNIILSALLVAVTCYSQAPPEPLLKGGPVATVGGQVITEDELTPMVQGQLRELEYQEYLIRRKALDDLINQKLLAAQASEKGLSTEEFLLQYVDSKVPEPTDVEVKAFYFRQRNLSNTPFEQVKNQIVTALKQQSIERARAQYFDSLRQSSSVAVMLRPPRVQVSADPTRELGNPDAPVTIVEFADFVCPFCQKARPILQELVNKYKGEVRLTFRDFPLEEIHPGSARAAQAGRCATEQGKFWPFHDAVFGHPGRVSEADLRGYAAGIGLNAKQFESCLSTEKYKAQVEQDAKAAVDAGVSGTPAIFINGVFFNGLPSVSMLEATINDELAATRTQTTKNRMFLTKDSASR